MSSKGGLQNSPGRLWRAYFNATIYVPDEGRHMLKVLESAGPGGFIEELERLSALGSPWGSAMLGYVHLAPGADGKRNLQRVMELCERPAKAGDPYSLFVYAWALLSAGQRTPAYQAMEKAASLRFSPAALALSVFLLNGWGTEPSTALALRVLRLAAQLGHRGAFLQRCVLYRSGRVGIARWALGYVLAPFAFLRAWLAVWTDPFASRILIHIRQTGPLLEPQPRFALKGPFGLVRLHPNLGPEESSELLLNQKLVTWSHVGLAFVTVVLIVIQLTRAHAPSDIYPAGKGILAVAIAPYFVSALVAHKVLTHHRWRVAVFVVVLVVGFVLMDLLLLWPPSSATPLAAASATVTLWGAFAGQALLYVLAADRILRV